jgi:hypothetical protein
VIRERPSDAAGLAARRAVLRALREVMDDGAWSNLAVPAAVDALASEQDRAFASHLAYDTLRWSGTLEWALGHVLTRPLDRVEAPLQRVLRLGALQLLRTSVPAHAAVATSAALAREQVPARRGSSTVSCAHSTAAATRCPGRTRPRIPSPRWACRRAIRTGSSSTCSTGSRRNGWRRSSRPTTNRLG